MYIEAESNHLSALAVLHTNHAERDGLPFPLSLNRSVALLGVVGRVVRCSTYYRMPLPTLDKIARRLSTPLLLPRVSGHSALFSPF